MEAYFFQDPGIQEHIDHIIEKLFAVCLLTGPDADAEFQRGLKSAQKLVAALASVSSLSEGEIYNGVRQIIEQRLPDPRVIENFPVFNTILERMIMESASIAPPSPTIAGARVNIIDGRSTSKTDLSQVKIRAYENRIDTMPALPSEAPIEEPKEESKEESKEEPKEESKEESKAESKTDPETEPVQEPDAERVIEPEVELHTSARKLSKGAVKRPLSVPTEAEHLALVLSYLFPKASVRWNMNLAGYQFLAQVEDVLIYLDQVANGTEVEHKMRAEGWKTIVLNYEDLKYWRRLERQIRKTVERKNRKVKTL